MEKDTLDVILCVFWIGIIGICKLTRLITMDTFMLCLILMFILAAVM